MAHLTSDWIVIACTMSYMYELCGPYLTPEKKAEKQRLKAHRSAMSAKATEAAIKEWKALPQEERDRRTAAAHAPGRSKLVSIRMTEEARAYLEAQQAEDLRQLKERMKNKANII